MEKEKCPRCGINELNQKKVLNSLSRTDNKTYICPSCGIEEALVDAKMLKQIKWYDNSR